MLIGSSGVGFIISYGKCHIVCSTMIKVVGGVSSIGHSGVIEIPGPIHYLVDTVGGVVEVEFPVGWGS